MPFYPNEDNHDQAPDPEFKEIFSELDDLASELEEPAGTSSETSGKSSVAAASDEKDAGAWENGGLEMVDDPDYAEFLRAFPNIYQRRQKWTKRIPDGRTACAYASLNHPAFDPDCNEWIYRVEEYGDVENALAILLRLNELGVPAPAFREIARLPKSAYSDTVQQNWSRALQVADLHWLVLWHPDHVEHTSWSGLITAEGVLNFGKAWRFAGMRPSKGIDDKVVNQLDLTRRQQRELYMLFGSAEKAMRKSWFQGKGQGSQRSALRKMMQNAEHSPGPNPDANVAADRLTALAMAVLNSKSGKPSPTDVAKFCYLIRGEVVAPTNVPKRIQGPVERHLGSDYNWLPQD